MKKFLFSLLDWLYKKKCYICGSSKYSQKICPDCYSKIDFFEFVPHKVILGCKVFCAGIYENELQKIIRGVKYHNQKDLAYYQAKIMFDYWQNLDESNRKFQIIPVPLYATREKKRKYNHMKLVADEFSLLTGYEVNCDLVKRIKDTSPQYKLNRNQRMLNLANAFGVSPTSLPDCDILLFDDIATTGATFENIILALRAAGVNKNIVCFTTSSPFSQESDYSFHSASGGTSN